MSKESTCLTTLNHFLVAHSNLYLISTWKQFVLYAQMFVTSVIYETESWTKHEISNVIMRIIATYTFNCLASFRDYN